MTSGSTEAGSALVEPRAEVHGNGVYVLRARMRIAKPISEVFPFFAAAENLERITPPELRFRIVTPGPVSIHEGALIDYRLRLNGLPFSWRTEIVEWDPPHGFIDRQLRGPYARWVHRHTFATAPDAPDATDMVDEVEYRLPLWPLSVVALPIVTAKLRHIFTYRAQVIRELLG